MNRYQRELLERKESHLLRELPHQSCPIDFYSNDYLGMGRSEELHQSITSTFKELPVQRNGSTGSRLLSGNSSCAEEIESMIAAYHEVESALVFSTGYAANVGLISAIGTRGVSIISDELIHASLIDGIRLGFAQRHRFKHNDLDNLSSKLTSVSGDKIVLVESLYSMDGDIAPLKEILELCQKHGAELVVDEAHAAGVLGPKGKGLCHEAGIQNDVLAIVVTYGKAFGTHGAAVLCASWLKEYLVNFARSFIYSTAPGDHQMTAIKCAYKFVEKADDERDQLDHGIQYFVKKRNEASEFQWIPSTTAIQSLIIPGNEAVKKFSDRIIENGISVLPIRSPTVPSGTERLRFSIHSFNNEVEMNKLFELVTTWEEALL